MGRLYLVPATGPRALGCAKCSNFVADKTALVSDGFRGSTGPAALFSSVHNVILSDRSEKKKLLSGDHFVRSVSCKKCSVKLGWFYEMAMDDTLREKEGKTCLEFGLLKIVRGYPNDSEFLAAAEELESWGDPADVRAERIRRLVLGLPQGRGGRAIAIAAAAAAAAAGARMPAAQPRQQGQRRMQLLNAHLMARHYRRQRHGHDDDGSGQEEDGIGDGGGGGD